MAKVTLSYPCVQYHCLLLVPGFGASNDLCVLDCCFSACMTLRHVSGDQGHDGGELVTTGLGVSRSWGIFPKISRAYILLIQGKWGGLN